MEKEFSDCVKAFTDGAMLNSGHSSTATFPILLLGIDVSGRLSIFASASTAVVATITEALRVVITVPTRYALVLTNSVSAIQCIEISPCAFLTP